MTLFIKKKSLPKKYLILDHYKLLKTYTLIKANEYEQQKNSCAHFDDYLKKIRSIFLAYKKINQSDIFKGREKGKSRSLADLLNSSLDTLEQWHKNIAIETQSMFSIAQKIAENITDTPCVPQNTVRHQRQLIEKMSVFLRMEIYLPLSFFTEHSSLFLKWQQFYGKMELLSITKHDNQPELRIYVGKEIFSLCLSGIDIKYLLAKINAFFLKMNESFGQSVTDSPLEVEKLYKDEGKVGDVV
ncbi:MAG: hypothetical protein KC505_00920 [Myxococcales bacterium]|nr:hypothetical protein [Myxococcales bacterium]USN50343.1 MAG: hypothetical protein H6731_08765 [Myxococcales bacterium]